MTKTISVTFQPDSLSLWIDQPEEDIRTGELVEWIFHGVPENFAPMITFKPLEEEDENNLRYYGPFSFITQEIPGADGGRVRVWGIVGRDKLTTYRYRAMIQTGFAEDPFEEAYGNSPDSVGKTLVVSRAGKVHVQSGTVEEELDDHHRYIAGLVATRNPGKVAADGVKVVPITQYEQDGEPVLRIHDNHLLVKRTDHDTVIWDFGTVPQHPGWFPSVDFVGGEGMAYEDIQNMHFGAFNSITICTGKVIATGHAKVPGQYHYRVAMASASSSEIQYKSSPDPVVDYPEPTSGSGSGG